MSVKFAVETMGPMAKVLGPEKVKTAALDRLAELNGVSVQILKSIQRQVEARQIDLADPEELAKLKQTFGDHEVDVYRAWSNRN